jgi:hypothetical protein
VVHRTTVSISENVQNNTLRTSLKYQIPPNFKKAQDGASKGPPRPVASPAQVPCSGDPLFRYASANESSATDRWYYSGMRGQRRASLLAAAVGSGAMNQKD